MSRELHPHGLYAASSRNRRATRRFAFEGAYGAARGVLARRYVVLAARIAFAVVIVSVITTAAAFAYLYSHYSKVVDARLASGYLTSRAGVYAAPRVLRAGQRLTPERLGAALRRAGYVEGEASKVWNGKFKVEGDAVEIRPSEDRDEYAPGVVRVSFDRRGQIASVTGDGAPLDSFTLDPESLTSDPAEKTAGRAALSYAEVPDVLRDAVLSIEDRRFFEHGPVDLWGVARAIFSWDDADQDFKQGGSTITQQLVKNTYLSPERTLQRKFREAALASVIESRIQKQDIFALYCNEIYLGQRGSVAVRGVRQAARVYFGKDLKDLSLAESATIAGMIQSPGRYAPDRHPEEARTRRNVVLGVMLRDGRVTEEQARAASDEPVRVAAHERTDATAPYFIDYVNRSVESRLPPSAAEGAQGLRVYTTIDLDLQQLAEDAVARQTERLEKVFKGRRPQAALVALDPRTGRVLAMVGGTSYAESQLNRATDARRQPGSVFKPVVYAAAMEGGISPLTLSTDAPREFTYDVRAKYRPANYGGGFSMRDVTLRTGLVRSLNVVTVDVALRAGLTRVATLAQRLGLPKPETYPSLALGTTEATPLEVATAYTAFAEEGRVVRPDPVLRVDGAGGRTLLQENIVSAEQVLKPSTAYMLTDMLSAVVDHGTARAARGAFKGVAVAGKTGTARDGWFAGYTPNLVCVVWVGFDDGTELNMTGADAALPAWTDFVRRATELRPELGGRNFDRPSSITTVDIDPETGQIASASCPDRERVALAPGFVPDHECSIHGDPWGLKALAASAAADALNPFVETNPPAPAAYESAATPRAVYAAQVTTKTPRDAYDDAEAYGPAPRATRVETGRDGRRRLTNDLRVAPKGDGGWQE
ncbi:MAG TPA: PBP1A family penicillin-binding protein [Pyrinomonadaceae bacterium]|jgi:penicillin-binding protein 1B|nr:PBP1A family penicillin-binding protein [Pyrinomonadaceae bacterium]